MKKQSGLAKRMKEIYQDAFSLVLPGRTNVIVRLDGKSFGTYTKGLETPFDADFAEDMDMTAKYLCEKVQGCKFAYVQSDEISLLITDYDNFETTPWFGNKIQKIVSVTASMATAEFNRLRLMREFKYGKCAMNPLYTFDIENFRMAEFDSRTFIIPDKEEVVNYFLWRQQDATRNSISMAGQKYFKSKMKYKSSSEVQDMLMSLDEPINWNDYPTRFKRGGMIIYDKEIATGSGFYKSIWRRDEMPIISKDRDYLLSKMPKID